MSDPKDKGDQSPFSDSSELFENLFKDLPLEEEKKPKQAPRPAREAKPAPELRRKPQAQTKQPPKPLQEAPPARQAQSVDADAMPPGRRVDFSRRERAARPTPPPSRPLGPTERAKVPGPLRAQTVDIQEPGTPLREKRPASKGKKSSRVPRAVLLFILLMAGGAAAASYLGLLDFNRYAAWFEREEPKPAQPQVARTGPEKKPVQQVPARPAPERPKPQTTQQEAALPAKAPPPQEAPLPRTETPAAVPVQPPPQVAVKPPEPPAPPRPESAVPPIPPIIPPQVAQKQPPQAPRTEPDLAVARPEPAKAEPSLQGQPAQYPFSVYLGSQSNLDLARTAVSLYEKSYGTSPYWVKVDLGEKGVWYRIFTGYFETEHEAEAYIKEKQIKDGEVKITKFSALIGTYSNQAEAAETVRRLSEIGYASYAIPGPGEGIRLFSGAFYTWQGAQRQVAELASRGFTSKAVER